jgi:serine/threonine-protein kinase
MSAPRFAFSHGELIDQKYLVERVLGAGGMGLVVLARHKTLGHGVAIKVLTDVADAEGCARFIQEGRAAVQLRSEHVVRVFDVGTLPDGRPFLVMEHLEGQDLAELLRMRGPMDPPDIARHMVQVCDALSEAHELGIVHRDLKPANIYVVKRRDGTSSAKVMDFGISKMAASPEWGRLTGDMSVLGTPLYMSPEQLRQTSSCDARSDIWSLGVTMFELATGRPPFDAAAITQLARNILFELPALPALDNELPDPLRSVVLRCLDKRPERRFQSASELSRALHSLLLSVTEATTRRKNVAAALDAPESATLRIQPPLQPAPAADLRPPAPLPAEATTLAAANRDVQGRPSEAGSLSFALGSAFVILVALAAGSGLAYLGRAQTKRLPPQALATTQVQPSVPLASASPTEPASFPSAALAPAPALSAQATDPSPARSTGNPSGRPGPALRPPPQPRPTAAMPTSRH